MKHAENGVLFGSIYVPDEIIVRTSWLLPATAVPLAMVIHLLSGNSRDFPFFISEADFPGVERWVFTIGLAISGLMQMIFASVCGSNTKQKSQQNYCSCSCYAAYV